MYFLIQGPIRTQINRGFFEDYYFPEYDKTQLWNHVNGVTKKERARVACPTHLGMPPVLFSPSEHRNRLVKAPEGSLDPKTPYIKVSEASREEGSRRSRNTEILPEPATIGGGLSSIAAQGEISTPPRSGTSSQ